MPVTGKFGFLRAELLRQRYVVYAALGIALSSELVFDLVWSRITRPGIQRQMLISGLWLLHFLIASVVGGFAFVPVRGDRAETSPRPFSSISSWWIRVMACILASLVSLVITGIAVAFSFRNWHLGFADAATDFDQYISFYLLLAAPALAFACSILYSMLLRPGIRAALAGFAIAIAVFVPSLHIWLRLDFNSGGKSRWITADILLTAFIVLIVSAIIYLRQIRLGQFVVRFLQGSAVIFIAGTLVFLPLAAACMRAAARTVDLAPSFPAISPTGEWLATSAMSPEADVRQIWLMPVVEGRSRRLLRNHSYEPDFSPDGQWISYFSHQTSWGLRSDFVDLRIARVDGSRDQIAVPGFARWLNRETEDYHGKAFSPDGNRLAINCGRMLYIAGLNGQAPLVFSLDPEPWSRGRVIGWRMDGSEVLLLGGRYDRYAAFNPGTGEMRTIYAPSELRRFRVPRGNWRNVMAKLLFAQSPAVAAPGRPPSATGQRSIPDWRIVADLSDDGGRIAGTVNDANDAVHSNALVHWLDLETGQDTQAATLTGRIGRLAVSPSGNKAAVGLWLPERVTIIQNIVVTGNFDAWRIEGWADDSRVVLSRHSPVSGSNTLAVGDIATLKTRVIYP